MRGDWFPPAGSNFILLYIPRIWFVPFFILFTIFCPAFLLFKTVSHLHQKVSIQGQIPPPSESGLFFSPWHRAQQWSPKGTLNAKWASCLFSTVTWFTYVGPAYLQAHETFQHCSVIGDCWGTVVEKPLYENHEESGRPHGRVGFRKMTALGDRIPNNRCLKVKGLQQQQQKGTKV